MDEFIHIETKTKGDYSCDNIYDSLEYSIVEQASQRAGEKKKYTSVELLQCEHFARI